jgi:radical SAM superfamily enzyme YgiQ (UPF0313 family)
MTTPVRFLFVHAWHGFALAEWYLRSALRSACGVEVSFQSLDLPPHGVPASDGLVRVVSSWQPDVVGFSCHFWSLPAFLDAAAAVKLLLPDAKVVLGGPQVGSRAAAEAVLTRCPAVDFVVRGPGEEALCRLAECLAAGAAPDAVPGLSRRSEDGTLCHAAAVAGGRQRGPIFEPGNVELTRALGEVREVSYETLAGCRLRCAYCYYPSRSFELLDDELVRAELKFLCAQRVPDIRICDTHFGGTAARAKSLLRLLREANQRSRVWIYPDLAHVDDEYLGLVRDAGAEIVSIGIQSTDPQVLARVRRPSLAGQREAIRLVLRSFPRVPADVIVGLPGDDLETLERTFGDVLDLGFSAVNVFRLMLFPGTALEEEPAAFYEDEAPVVSAQGQVLFSGGLHRADQAAVAGLAGALEVMAPLSHTRVHLAGRGLGNPLRLAMRLEPERLLELSRALAPESRGAVGRRAAGIIDTLAPVLGDGDGVRDCIALDLAELADRRGQA